MLRLPPHGSGQRIGLFGGSFNPAHRGHLMVALYALKHLRLDWVWWLVSPQNPLKDKSETSEYAERLKYAKRIAKHPRFVVTDIEQQMQSKFTADTLRQLRQKSGDSKFVWIMGADSLASLHHWHDWLDIAATMPLAVLARPGYSIKALRGPAALRFAGARVAPPARIFGKPPPAWTFVTMPLRRESSTAIRRRRTIAKSKT